MPAAKAWIMWLAGVFSFPTALATVAIGILILRVDIPRMQGLKLNRETAFSRSVGWTYIIGSIVLLSVTQIALRILGP